MKTLKKFLVPLLVLASLASFAVVPTSAAPANPGLVICLGKDTATGGDGTSASSPLATGTAGSYTDAPMYQAWTKILNAYKTSGVTEAVIVFTDVYYINNDDANYDKEYDYDVAYYEWAMNKGVTITCTSVWDGVDYRATQGAKVVLDGKTCLTFPTNTITENITIQGSTSNDDTRPNYVCGGFCSLYLGQGTNFVPDAKGVCPYVVGGYRNASKAYGGIGAHTNSGGYKLDRSSTNVTVDIGDENNIGYVAGGLGMADRSHSFNINITIKSGNFVNWVYGDGINQDGRYGTSGTINMMISGGKFAGCVVLSNSGFATNTNASTLTITGGSFNAKFHNQYTTANTSLYPAANFSIDCSNCNDTTYTNVVNKANGLSVIAPTPFKNATTGVRYKTLAEACAAANSGDEIHLNASATEANVVIPRGVTLFLGENTLTADAIIGLAGSGIYGNTASCKIVVPQGNLILGESIFTKNGNSFLPYWDAANNCYKFSTVGLNTDGLGMTKTDSEITFKFKHGLAQSARDVIGTAASDNGVKVAVQLRWMVGNNEAVQNFYFSDADFATVEGGGNYTFSLTNYAELGIDGATVEIQPMVVTDTGVVFYGETWVNGAIAQ